MKTKHTPEPWDESLTPMITKGDCTVKINDRPMAADARVLSEPNFQRAIKCVNACAGMEDPAAEIAALRERIAELEAKRPTKPEPNWDEAPDWAQWWAVDENGEEWWYEIKPVALASCWTSYERERKKDTTDINSLDWRETLTHRP